MQNLSIFAFLTFIALPTLICSQTPTPTTLPETRIIVSDGGEPPPEPNKSSLEVVNGKAVNLVKPPYPPAAAAVRASGAVQVKVVIDENGNVIYAEAISGHQLLRMASEAAARASKFTPTIMAQNKVKVTGIIVYNFIPSTAPISGVNKTSFGDSSTKRNALIENSKLVKFALLLENVGRYGFISPSTLGDISYLLPAEFVSEKELILKIPQYDPTSRKKMIEDIFSLLKSKISPEDMWQIRLGRSLEHSNYQIRGIIYDEKFPFDEIAFQSDIFELRELLQRIPSDFPFDFKESLQNVTSYSKPEDIKKADNLIMYARNIQKMLNKIINPIAK